MCDPAELPDEEVCIHSEHERQTEFKSVFWTTGNQKRLFCNKRWLKKCSSLASRTLQTAFCEHYLSFGIDFSLGLQQEVHHLYIAIVTGHMQGRISHLNQNTETHITLLFPAKYMNYAHITKPCNIQRMI